MDLRSLLRWYELRSQASSRSTTDGLRSHSSTAYLIALAPFKRRSITGIPAASVTTIVTFYLFLRASASAASITCAAISYASACGAGVAAGCAAGAAGAWAKAAADHAE